MQASETGAVAAGFSRVMSADIFTDCVKVDAGTAGPGGAVGVGRIGFRLDFRQGFQTICGVPVPSLPQRQSLVAQTVVCLQDRITGGEWREWLPSERALCSLLQVSRNTLRAALAQLGRTGHIRPVHGAGNQILAKAVSRRSRPQPSEVALLSPEPIERLRPMQSLWIDDLRGLLSERGMRLRVFSGRHYYAANPGPILERIVTRSPHGCWLLMLASEEMQRWFSRRAIPCLVAGSTFPGLDLPFRDLDHRAMCRHAAGVLLGLGHRRLVMLAPESRPAGDVASEAGFIEGVRQANHPEAEALVVHHAETVAGVTQAVRRIRKLGPTPTAWLVLRPHHYLAASSQLVDAGVRIPRDISMISRDDDPFLSFMMPMPARYGVSPHVMARSLLRPLLELMKGEAVSQRAGLIMPEFIKGASIAAPSKNLNPEVLPRGEDGHRVS